MIGRWVDKDDNVDIETDCQWTKNRSFITRSFTVASRAKSICPACRSSVGIRPPRPSGHGRSTPTAALPRPPGPARKVAGSFENKGILADGRKASMVNVIKQVDQNSFTWQTIERTAGGELLPNVNEVLIVRE